MPLTDYPDWRTPQAHADAISFTGAPLLNLKGLLADNAVGVSVPASSLLSLPASGNFSIGQVSYEAYFSVGTSGATATPVQVTLFWFDSASGLVVATQVYTFFAGTLAGPHVVEGNGPSNSDQLLIAVNNNSGANAITVIYTVLQSSRPRSRHMWRTQGVPSVPGFTMASSQPGQNVICAESQSIAANSGKNLLLPLYTGTVRMFGTTTDGTGGNLQIVIFYNSALLTVNDINAYKWLGNSGFSPAGQNSVGDSNIALPNSQMSIQLFNKNATTTETLTAHLIAQQFQG